VVADRYLDSSLVYQGVVRGLGVGEVRALSLFAVEDRLPDRTVLLELEPDEAATRRQGRPDRIESEPGDFQASVARGYAGLAGGDADPHRADRGAVAHDPAPAAPGLTPGLPGVGGGGHAGGGPARAAQGHRGAAAVRGGHPGHLPAGHPSPYRALPLPDHRLP